MIGNMADYTELLKQIDGGRVLDAATGSGGFIHFLCENLKSYQEIVGVDANPRLELAFQEAFKERGNLRFAVGDVRYLDYAGASFDTVAMANSLHHLDDPVGALRELLRVLSPGGNLILLEMYCDGQSETQMTHVHLHHWWAAVDMANGVVHHETYRRADLLALLEGFELADLRIVEINETADDPRDPEIQQQLDPVIDRYIQRADGHPHLQRRGEELRRRVAEIGFHSTASILFLGRK